MGHADHSLPSDQLIATVSWTLGITELDPLMSFVADAELNAVQYCARSDLHEAAAVKNAATSHGLRVIAYDPFECRPSRPEAATREGALDFYRDALDYAAALQVPLTIHGLATWAVNAPSDAAQWDLLAELVQTIVDEAAARAVPTLFEPCNLYEIPLVHSSDDFFRLDAMLEGDALGILLDSFHMHIHERDELAAIERSADRLGIYHVSDSGRGGIGTGQIDFGAQHAALRAIGFRGPVAMEFVLPGNPVNTPPRDELERARLQAMLRESAMRWREYSAAHRPG